MAFSFQKQAGSSVDTWPIEDTSVYLLLDSCLVLGHQCLCRFQSGCLLKLCRVYEAACGDYLACWA